MEEKKKCSNCKNLVCLCNATRYEPAEYGCQYEDEYLLEDGCEKWEEA